MNTDISQWEACWESGDTGWKMPDADRHFFELFPVLQQKYSLKTGSALVPLCGDSPVVRFLYDNGFHVTAVDAVSLALNSLRQLHFADLTLKEERGAITCDRLALVRSDIFTFNVEVPVSIIHDRAALVALSPDLRASYVSHLLSQLAPGGVVFLETFICHPEIEEGPPYYVPVKEVDYLYQRLKLRERHVKKVTNLAPGLRKKGITAIEKVISIFQQE